jgi:hypothetical protein
LSFTIKTTKVTAASSSLEDIFAVLHTHFQASEMFQSILPASVGGEHTIYIQSRTPGQLWRFALSSIGLSVSGAAASMEPDYNTAPSGINPSTGATAQFSGISSRFMSSRSRFMLVTEIFGLGRDAVFIHFYTDVNSFPSYPFRDTVHFGRILTPLTTDIPGVDGLGMISGICKWSFTFTSNTGTEVPIIARNSSGSIQLQRSRMRHGLTAWNEMRWQWASARSTSSLNSTLQSGRVVEPILVGTNTTPFSPSSIHEQTPMLAQFNHMVLWNTNLAAGGKLTDSTNQREYLCPTDTSLSGQDQVLCRLEFGFDVTP